MLKNTPTREWKLRYMVSLQKSNRIAWFISLSKAHVVKVSEALKLDHQPRKRVASSLDLWAYLKRRIKVPRQTKESSCRQILTTIRNLWHFRSATNKTNSWWTTFSWVSMTRIRQKNMQLIHLDNSQIMNISKRCWHKIRETLWVQQMQIAPRKKSLSIIQTSRFRIVWYMEDFSAIRMIKRNEEQKKWENK